jgi:hypothetical protein
MPSRLEDCARCQVYCLTHPGLLDAVMGEVENNPTVLTVESVLDAFLYRYHAHGHRVVVSA